MPDLLGGSTVRALDTPPTVGDTQDASFTCTNTTFGVGSTGGSYADCAVVFVAGTTGRALVLYAANLDNGSGAAATNVAPHVREGAVVGSGADVEVATLNNSVRNVGSEDRRYGAHLFLEGLTPGDSYNVRLEHRVSGDTGTIQYRTLTVMPAT